MKANEYNFLFKALLVASVFLLIISVQVLAQSAPPGFPVLSSPSHGAFIAGTSVELEWEAPAGATHYNVWVFNLSTDQLLYYELVAGDTTYTVEGLPDNGEYIAWSVTAADINVGLWSDFAVPRIFQSGTDKAMAPPTLISPADVINISGTTADFEWDAPEGALAYHIAIINDTTGELLHFNERLFLGDEKEFTFGGLPDNGDTILWTVVAAIDVGIWSDFAFPRTFVNGEPPGELEIVDIVAITESVSVPYGTSEQNAVKSLYDLTEFEGEVDGGDNVSLTVSDWAATDGYDGNVPGSYPFEGQASAPEGYVFAAGVSQTVNATVIVQEFTHSQEVGSIINIDKDDNMIIFRVLDVDDEFYDGSSPGSVQLRERAGAGLTDNDKVRADSITWLSNISEDGEAQIIYSGLQYKGPTDDDSEGTATVTVVIETDDSAVASIFTVELTYSAGQDVWRNADIIDVYGGEPLNPKVESIETILAGARASKSAIDGLFSIEAKNNGPSGSGIIFYFAPHYTLSGTYVDSVYDTGYGVIEIDVVLSTDYSPGGALVSTAKASDVKAAIEANEKTNDLVNVTVNLPNDIVLRQTMSLEGGERTELQVTWNEDVELVPGAALFTLQGITATSARHVHDNDDKITLIWDDVPLYPVSDDDILTMGSGAIKSVDSDLINLQESWWYEAMSEQWVK